MRDQDTQVQNEPKLSAEFEAIQMIYELTELVWYDMPDGLPKTRLQEMRQRIRDTYDESVWKR